MTVRAIGIFAMDGAQLLDVSGPADVFAEANVQVGEAIYQVSVLGEAYGRIRTSSGVRIEVDGTVGHDRVLAADTLLIAGAPHLHRRARDEDLLKEIRAAASAAKRFGSVCTGAMLLAQAGLLNGCRATTHWSIAEHFARSFPDVVLEIDAIHVRDGRVRTAAGVTAGLDLALSLVEEDLGPDIARQVAGQLVMYFRRPGGQLQHGRASIGRVGERSILQGVQRWIVAHPAERHGVADLAARAGLSPRHFARVFRAEIGETPSAWVERARIAAARAMLEEGRPTKVVASLCGFHDAETFRRAFQRRVGVSPASYRSSHHTGR